MNKERNLGKPYNEPDGVIPIRLSFTAANPFPRVIASSFSSVILSRSRRISARGVAEPFFHGCPNTIVMRPFKVVQSCPLARLKPRNTFLHFELSF
jgi:hypothetical protein